MPIGQPAEVFKDLKMKIVFVTPRLSYCGGIRVILTYVSLLRKRGYEVTVISTYRPERLKKRIKDFLKEVVCFNRKELAFPLEKKVTYRFLKRPVIESDVPDADVIIATWWETAWWIKDFSSSKGVKVYFVQDFGAPYQELEKISPTWKFPFSIITISHWLAALIRDHACRNDIDVIENSVDLGKFYAPVRHKQQELTVGLCYYPASTKGMDLLARAVMLAQLRLPSLRVKMFGMRPLDAAFCKIKNRVYSFRASDEEIIRIYSSSDAWLFASSREGFGLPILEAMACRTPVITTPAGAAPELLKSGGGVLVRPNDPEDMAEAIVKVGGLSNEDWRKMSQAAYERATSYTWDDAVDLFERALKKSTRKAS